MRLVITGHVQGVYFRAETKRKADELGLTGWVRNRPDGSVEVFAQGPEGALEELEQWCFRGPPAAEVRNISRKDGKCEGESGVFEVLL